MEAILFPDLRRPGKRSASIGGMLLYPSELVYMIFLKYDNEILRLIAGGRQIGLQPLPSESGRKDDQELVGILRQVQHGCHAAPHSQDKRTSQEIVQRGS